MVSGALLINCGASVGRPPASKARALAETPNGTDLHESHHVRFGLPRDADPRDDYLIDRGAYVASYNPKRGVANWVAWRLTADDLGTTDRSDAFRADDRLPLDFYRVLSTDYKGAGYDRGHLCPSAHRTRDASTNSTTFLMTNMMPQVHALNAGPWKGIETYERELVAKQGQDVYVVAGGIFRTNPKTIGRGVAVPAASYRVTIVVRPGQGPSDVTNATPVLAVEMPNDISAKGRHWAEFRVSVDDVERDTGYDYLSGLPDEVEAGLEARASGGLGTP
ncbi:MAG TPA: DNA/RNA non-specific endonuclease [Polyangiaceae bacterium]|nr:DNA/RNA non-specific endonuclease [Polyangiaceae bacterium]